MKGGRVIKGGTSAPTPAARKAVGKNQSPPGNVEQARPISQRKPSGYKTFRGG